MSLTAIFWNRKHQIYSEAIRSIVFFFVFFFVLFCFFVVVFFFNTNLCANVLLNCYMVNFVKQLALQIAKATSPAIKNLRC